MATVRSLGNEVDELTALSSCEPEYCECSILCFQWLHREVPDNNVVLAGFRISLRAGSRKEVDLPHSSTSDGVIPVARLSINRCFPDVEFLAASMLLAEGDRARHYSNSLYPPVH